MKTVQDKDGNIVEVADDTPCHAGKNGALPVMLDKVLDKKIFDDIEQKERDWQADAPNREVLAIIQQRNAERGTIAEQLEYLIDNGIEKLRQRDDEIKTRHPKKVK